MSRASRAGAGPIDSSIAHATIARMPVPRFRLNRFDLRSVDAFVADVRRAEALG